MSEIEEIKRELGRVMGVLSKIRDVVECDDPRYPSLEWYRSKLEHVRRYLREVFDDGGCGDG